MNQFQEMWNFDVKEGVDFYYIKSAWMDDQAAVKLRSEEHTSELQSHSRI